MRDGQRLLCNRLHNELAVHKQFKMMIRNIFLRSKDQKYFDKVLKEFKTLREEEKQRVEGRQRAMMEKKARAREAEERQRRERERQDIVAWRRNRIEVATLSRMQVGACVFNPS